MAITNASGFTHVAGASRFAADAKAARGAKPDADAIIAQTISGRAVTWVAGVKPAEITRTAGSAMAYAITRIAKASADAARSTRLTLANATRTAKAGRKAGANAQAFTEAALSTRCARAKAADTRAEASAKASAEPAIASIAWTAGAEPAGTTIAQAGTTVARAAVASSQSSSRWLAPCALRGLGGS